MAPTGLQRHGRGDEFCAETNARTVRGQAELAAAGALPPWLGNEELHRSHRSALVRKDAGHYRPLFGGVPDDLPYVWPVRSERALEAERAARARAAGGARRTRRRVRARGTPTATEDPPPSEAP